MRSRCVLLVLSLALPAAAQLDRGPLDEAMWAHQLAEEFGFDDMAETVFRRLAAAREPHRQLKGKLGLATLKRRQAGRSRDDLTRLQLLDEAVALAGEVMDAWPASDVDGRAAASNRVVDIRAERARAAFKASRAPRTSDVERRRLIRVAVEEFTAAEKLLVGLMSKNPPEYEDDEEGWRAHGRAHLRLLWLLLDKAITSGTPERPDARTLFRLQAELEDYLLHVEGGGGDGAVAALHGYLILGRTRAALGEPDAGHSFSHVIDTVIGAEGRIAPGIQDLAERAQRRWLEWLVIERRFAEAAALAERLEERFSARGFRPRVHGRHAVVEHARALIGMGREDVALGKLAALLDVDGRDGAARAASQVIEDIVAAAGSSKELAPETLRAAARSAFATGPSRREAAAKYLTMLLERIDAVKDESTRDRWRAEAWYDLARVHWFSDTIDECRKAAEAGTRACRGKAPDGLDLELAKLWRRAARRLARERPGPGADAAVQACNQWLAENPVEGLAISFDYELADAAARRGHAHDVAGRLKEARSEFEAAISGFIKAANGPRRESALKREARARLRRATILAKMKAPDREVVDEARMAMARYADLVAYADDPANVITDPAELERRDDARGESWYGTARALRLILDRTPTTDADGRRKLARQTIATLRRLEKRWPDDEHIALSALSLRAHAELELGRIEHATKTFESMVMISVNASRTLALAQRLGRLLRSEVAGSWTGLTEGIDPADTEAWSRLEAKPGYAATRERLLQALNYDVHVCTFGKQVGPQTWDFATQWAYRLAAWDVCRDLGSKAFASKTPLGADVEARIRRRLLIAACVAGDAAWAAGRFDEAQRLRFEATRQAEADLDRFGKDPVAARRVALLFGGRLARKDGRRVYDLGQGRFEDALELWKRIETHHAALGDTGSHGWWEAKFHSYHLAFRIGQKTGQSNAVQRKRLATLKAVYPELGGRQWQPLFEWLERQVIINARLPER